MSSYCEGSACSRKNNCRLHNPGEGIHEYLDWSTYGSGSFIKSKDGKYESNIEYSCGDAGKFKKFEPLTKEDDLINEINVLFHEAMSKVLKPADIQIVELLLKQEGTLLNELWSNVVETIYKHNIK